jgi:hypothetical protein
LLYGALTGDVTTFPLAPALLAALYQLGIAPSFGSYLLNTLAAACGALCLALALNKPLLGAFYAALLLVQPSPMLTVMLALCLLSLLLLRDWQAASRRRVHRLGDAQRAVRCARRARARLCGSGAELVGMATFRRACCALAAQRRTDRAGRLCAVVHRAAAAELDATRLLRRLWTSRLTRSKSACGWLRTPRLTRVSSPTMQF